MRNLITLSTLFLMTTSCQAQSPTAPAVVELFQSQGCSSCPPANAVLNALADRKDLITLSFSVTYWDYLGWKDSFARPEYTARQNDYALGLHNPSVYTPQMVINGRGAIVGTQQAQLDKALLQFARTGTEPEITKANEGVTIASQAGRAATVWLVSYDPRRLDVPIGAGENAGRTLPHNHIVKQLAKLGEWNGTAQTFALIPASESGLVSVILLQKGRGGPIIGAKVL